MTLTLNEKIALWLGWEQRGTVWVLPNGEPRMPPQFTESWQECGEYLLPVLRREGVAVVFRSSAPLSVVLRLWDSGVDGVGARGGTRWVEARRYEGYGDSQLSALCAAVWAAIDDGCEIVPDGVVS